VSSSSAAAVKRRTTLSRVNRPEGERKAAVCSVRVPSM
jgi:hypothetical protein